MIGETLESHDFARWIKTEYRSVEDLTRSWDYEVSQGSSQEKFQKGTLF